jgi:uncharacterized protein (TIGR03085 family)
LGRVTNYAQSERVALCDLLEELGPEAPTLCDGWTTAELAAHLVVRESTPQAAGIMLPQFAEQTNLAMTNLLKRYGFEEVVRRLRSGPPKWSPTRLRFVDEAINTAEFFVHHEDVRRAREEWEPRKLPTELEDQFWKRASVAGRFMFRKVAVGLLLARNNGQVHRVRDGDPTAVLSGKPSEITLYAFGRKSVARVELSGPDVAVEALAQTPLGV